MLPRKSNWLISVLQTGGGALARVEAFQDRARGKNPTHDFRRQSWRGVGDTRCATGPISSRCAASWNVAGTGELIPE